MELQVAALQAVPFRDVRPGGQLLYIDKGLTDILIKSVAEE